MQSQDDTQEPNPKRPLFDSQHFSSNPRATDDFYINSQMSAGATYTEPLRDSSSSSSRDGLGSLRPAINGGQTNGTTVFRRARAETFSAFSSPGLFQEESSVHTTTAPPANIAVPRARAGSLSLPRTTIQNAFGPSLFATSWQPSTNGNGLSERLGHSEYGSSAGGEDDPNAARTINYLGIDDPLSETSRLHAQDAYQQLSRNMPSSIGGIHPGRGRAYSVAVGENLSNLSLAIPTPASSMRPRATSIAFIESTADSELQAMMNRVGRGLDIESPGSEHRSDGDIFNTSPGEYMPYGLERNINDSPTRSHFSDHPHPHQIPSRSLWIGNIDPTISASDLQTLFSPFGPIESLRILPDKECAFVNYVYVEHAIRARDAMQGQRVGHCIVRIGFGRAEAANDTQGQQPTKSLWVGNIPPTTDPAELQALFSRFGAIESARVLTHKNCGFVNFYRLEDAMEARKVMNGQEIGGSVVKIAYAKVPSKNDPGLGLMSDTAYLYGNGSLGLPQTRQRSNSSSSAYSFSAAAGLGSSSAQIPFSSSRSIDGYVPGDFGMAPPPFSLGLDDQLNGGGGSSSGRYTGLPSEYTDAQIMTLAMTGTGPTLRKESAGALDSLADALWSGLALNGESYATAIPPVPEPRPNRRVDQGRLREMRKRLEGHVTMKDVEAIFHECLEETVDLCTDYIGNVVIQKVIEKSSDQHRLRLLEKVAPHMAAVGIHKNGTWVVQKMIDYAKTTTQIHLIVNSLKPFTPPLLLDQFGNYVVQCCLRLGTHRNQFIFDAMHTKCWEIGQGRFGARAMRTILESQYTTKRQQKIVAEGVVLNAIQLATNPNGAILVTWLLDTSSLPGRYQALAPKLAPHVPALCTHKLASATILKLVNQRIELEARDQIIKEIFYRDDISLEQILADQVHGVSVIQKILASACVSPEEKTRLADRVRSVLARMPEVRDNQMGYKRLLDELSVIPSSLGIGGGLSLSIPPAGANGFGDQDIVSPLAPQHSGFTFSSPNHAGVPSGVSTPPPPPSWYGANGVAQLPTPSHSPQPGIYGPAPPAAPYGMGMQGYQGGNPSVYGNMPPMPMHMSGFYPGGSYPPSPQHAGNFGQQSQSHQPNGAQANHAGGQPSANGDHRLKANGYASDPATTTNGRHPESE